MTRSERREPAVLSALAGWQPRNWAVALASALLAATLVAVPTDLVDTPLFSREIPPTWWSYPTLAVTALLAGLLVGTYVDVSAARASDRSEPTGRASRSGGLGGILTFFAVGCPVCNKLVLLALGASGALQYFEPIQPLLAVGSVALLGWALRQRLQNANACPSTPRAAEPEQR